MARTKSIRFQMKSQLHNMEAYGRSKKADQQKTKEERTSAKSRGIPFEEYRKIDYTKDYIYSYNTMKNYQHEIDRYADYLKDHDMNKITMLEAKEQIQPYLNYLEDKGLTAQSIHTTCAALCKTFQTSMWDYDKPNRSIAHIVRGTKTFDKDVDMVRELEKNPIWKINRDYLGMRKNELLNLKAGMIKEIGDRVEIHYIGKGGKHNRQVFVEPAEKAFVLSLKNNKADNERVFDRQAVKKTLNLHKARELRSKEVYHHIVADIEKNGITAQQKYIDEIQRMFKEAHKTLRENLDTPYYVRTDNRQRLSAEERPLEYNRVALLYVSCTITQHFRSSVTLNHYVGK